MRYVRVAVLALAILVAGAGAVDATGPIFDPSGITAEPLRAETSVEVIADDGCRR